MIRKVFCFSFCSGEGASFQELNFSGEKLSEWGRPCYGLVGKLCGQNYLWAFSGGGRVSVLDKFLVNIKFFVYDLLYYDEIHHLIK